METVHLNVTCHLVSMFTIGERSDGKYALYSIFKSSLQSTVAYYVLTIFSLRVVGTSQTSYRYYCPSMIANLNIHTSTNSC
jgi:hypothetical protein